MTCIFQPVLTFRTLCIAPGNRTTLNDELRKMYEESVVAYFKVLSLNFPGATEVSHEKPQSLELVSMLRFEPGILQYQTSVIATTYRCSYCRSNRS